VEKRHPESGYHHRARKRFGQNFLVDDQIIDRIIRSISPKPEDNLVEIGPGQGALTGPLLHQLNRLQAVELDRDLAKMLTSKFHNQPGFELHQGDALKFDFSTLASRGALRIVGNLPYNISTPLIFRLLEFSTIIRDMHFMLQKEVVDRMTADPGSKTFGRLSVIVQYHCQVVDMFTVPPTAFHPAPKVESAIVRLTPRQPDSYPAVANDPAFFYALVKTSFQQRRKTLRNTLKQLEVSGETGIDLGRRPETLSVAEFVQLSNELVPA
jgi:16S rRNA (adenine1518-N6/adenine1519-N6)-dimethyltransferase